MRSRLGLVTGWSAATGSQLRRKVPIQKRRRNFQSYLMDSPPPASSTSTTIFSQSDKGGWVCSARLPELIGRTVVQGDGGGNGQFSRLGGSRHGWTDPEETSSDGIDNGRNGSGFRSLP